MTSVKRDFHHLTPYDGEEQTTAANGQHLSISCVRPLALTTPQNQSLKLLYSTYFVPKLSTNHISIDQLVNQGYSIIFSPSGCVIQELHTRRMSETGQKQGRLFLLYEGLGSFQAFTSFSSNALWTL